MPKLTIDGRAVEVGAGATVLEAARMLGIEIPTLCHLDGFDPSTSCMTCVVRLDGAAHLVPSCATVATEGMQVLNDCDEVFNARRTALELLLSDHTGDCVAPCQRADAQHADIPHFLRQVAAGDLEGAAATLQAAGVDLDDLDAADLERAEKACRRGRLDERIAIAEIARFVAEKRGSEPSAAPKPPPYSDFSVRTGRLTVEELQQLSATAGTGPQLRPADSSGDHAGIEAASEAARCQHCDCRMSQQCGLRRACEVYGASTRRFTGPKPPLEQDRSHPDIIHEPGKCIRCGLCLQVAERAGEKLGLAFVGRGFNMRLQVPFGAPLARALETSGGSCADVCPTGSLVRVERS